MMKAVRLYTEGKNRQLRYEDAPIPSPAAGEVLVRVGGAGVNPIDWKVRDGFGAGWLVRPEPSILGFDVAGTVERIGADVSRFVPGDRVFGCTSLRRNGSFAQFCIALDSELAIMPASLDFAHAAGVPTVALTAWQGLFDLADVQPGQRVLVHAAAGGVGLMAVQLAKWKGAHVTGVASGRNEALCREAGADDYIDYTATKFEQAGRPAFDVVVDTVGGDYKTRSLSILRPGGFLLCMSEPLDESIAAARNVRTAMVRTRPDSQELGRIAELIDSGTIRVFIQTILPLEQFAEALELSESGRTRGKIVLIPPGD